MSDPVQNSAAQAAPDGGRPAREPAQRRERNKVDKRERIRDAAAALFEERGFAGTTTRMVAERAGVAAGTVFLYADDKHDLLFLVFHDRLRDVVERQRRSLPRGGPLIERLMHLFRGIFAMYGETPATSAEFVRSLPGARGRNADEVNALTFSFLATLATLVREARERGEVDATVDPLLAARNVFSLYFGALLGWLMGLAPTMELALDPVLRQSLELQMRGLAAR